MIKVSKNSKNIAFSTTVGLDLTNSVLTYLQKQYSPIVKVHNTPNVQLKYNVDFMMTSESAISTLK